jgi:hypothetical protein
VRGEIQSWREYKYGYLCNEKGRAGLWSPASLKGGVHHSTVSMGVADMGCG